IAYAQQRFVAMSEHERVYPPGDAIRELARLSGAASGIAVGFFDMALIESLPSLEPFLSLTPALQVIAQLIEAGRAWISGRGVLSQALYSGVLERIAQTDHAGFDDLQYDRIRYGVHYALALVESSMAISAAEERAKLLEQNRAMRVAAWRVRMLLHFNQGNTEAARSCMRRSELLQLQDGGESHYLGSTAGFELVSAAIAGDLLGVKTALDALELLADQHPGWKPMLIFGRGRYRELQGDLSGALEISIEGLAIALPGRHLVFSMLAASHVRLLHGLGRLDEAVAIGTEYLDVCEREELRPLNREIVREVAPVLAAAGEYERAVKLIETGLEWAERVGCEGLPVGVLYESRAKVALEMGDHAAFARASERCAIEFRKSNSPVLSARLAALLDDARRRQLPAPEAARELTVQLEVQRNETEYGNVRGRLFECLDRADRARCSLTILLQSAESFEGYLYGCDDDALIALAGLPGLDADEGLTEWLSSWVEAEQTADRDDIADENEHATERESSVTGTEESETFAPRHGVPSRYVDPDGRQFEAILLVGQHHEKRAVAGALVLQLTGRAQPRPSNDLLSQIASHLLDQGDVSGVVIDA
ncbi:MAG TPA: hypothetical protein VHZ95_16020, partial [Polyangiales bacterium]|nr:hypothetical protein [Polyangiales bacterium]